MISFHQAEYWVRIQIIGNKLQRISMHKEAVTLWIVNSNGTFGGKSRIGQFIIETIIARQHIFIDGICHSYIIERFTISHFPVIKQAVTNQLLSVIRQNRTIQQFCLFTQCIIKASFWIDMIIITHNIRRTENGSNLREGIIFQCIRCQYKLRIHQFHIMIEHRLFGSRTVFSPVWG